MRACSTAALYIYIYIEREREWLPVRTREQACAQDANSNRIHMTMRTISIEITMRVVTSS